MGRPFHDRRPDVGTTLSWTPLEKDRLERFLTVRGHQGNYVVVGLSDETEPLFRFHVLDDRLHTGEGPPGDAWLGGPGHGPVGVLAIVEGARAKAVAEPPPEWHPVMAWATEPPKPPSLKEQALAAVDHLLKSGGSGPSYDIIRRALETLP